MYILYDNEIKQLALEAEKLIRHQRIILPMLQRLHASNSKFDLIVADNPKALAKHMLQKKYHLDGDIKRLEKQIEANLSDMDWFNNMT